MKQAKGKRGQSLSWFVIQNNYIIIKRFFFIYIGNGVRIMNLFENVLICSKYTQLIFPVTSNKKFRLQVRFKMSHMGVFILLAKAR